MPRTYVFRVRPAGEIADDEGEDCRGSGDEEREVHVVELPQDGGHFRPFSRACVVAVESEDHGQAGQTDDKGHHQSKEHTLVKCLECH